MRPPAFSPPIFRISGRPRPEIAPGVTRPQGSRRKHHDGTVKDVRVLIETTTLTYEQISKRTGVSPASISHWTNDGEWKRPLFAPRAAHLTPTPRATAYLRHRLLAKRLFTLADRYVRELEETPGVDLDKLGQALELARMAKLATMSRTRRRIDAVLWSEPMRPVIELCSIGVDLRRAPREAVQDFLKNRALPPEKDRPPRSRGMSRRPTRAQRHARMLERE